MKERGYKVIYNELDSNIFNLFNYLVNNPFPSGWDRWVSRAEFKEKVQDGTLWGTFLFLAWSFGNGTKSYAFGVDKEEDAEFNHNLYINVQSGDNNLKEYNSQRIEIISRIRRLKKLYYFKGIECCNKSYDEISLNYNEDDVIIYCDPPYNGVDEYNIKFDHDKFYKWLKESPHQIFISEYSMPEEFIKLTSIHKVSTFSAQKNVSEDKEGLYTNKKIMPSYSQLSLFEGGDDYESESN